MGTYAYCENDHPLDVPTITQAVTGVQVCPTCNAERKLDLWDRTYALDEAIARQDAMLAQLRADTDKALKAAHDCLNAIEGKK